jgi:hypothetical protein
MSIARTDLFNLSAISSGCLIHAQAFENDVKKMVEFIGGRTRTGTLDLLIKSQSLFL